MVLKKRIVCLANSRKLSGRCIAGKEIIDRRFGGWVRPVSSRENEEVSEYERQYENGQDPKVMDVIDIPLLKPVPKGYQQENWLLYPRAYWRKSGRAKWKHLGLMTEQDTSLWIDGYHTYSGRNDKIPLEKADGLGSSLRLVHAERVGLSVLTPGAPFGDMKRRLQGRFVHDAHEYRLWVTDPSYEKRYLLKSEGEFDLGECYLTVSLGEPYKGAVYKLIAAVIERCRET